MLRVQKRKNCYRKNKESLRSKIHTVREQLLFDKIGQEMQEKFDEKFYSDKPHIISNDKAIIKYYVSRLNFFLDIKPKQKSERLMTNQEKAYIITWITNTLGMFKRAVESEFIDKIFVKLNRDITKYLDIDYFFVEDDIDTDFD